MPRLLILGGTAEALALAERAAALPGLEVVTSLAGRTRWPVTPRGGLRVGGFGGIEALAAYLERERVDALIDATHPFATRISRNATQAAQAAGVPRLLLQRAPWHPQAGDRWQAVADLAAAAATIPAGARVFLAVGRQGLPAFAERRDAWFLVRLVDPPEVPLPLARHQVVVGRGPFDAAAETCLLSAHAIACLVAKNSGGAGGYAKLAAARRLGLPVILVERPAPPPGTSVGEVDGALAWLRRTLGSRRLIV